MQASMEEDTSEFKTCAQRRKEARRHKNPHGSSPFKRFYLGPSPVASQAASMIAQAIAEDVKIEKPSALGVADKDGRLIVGRPSMDSLARPASIVKGKDEGGIGVTAAYTSGVERTDGNDHNPRLQRKDLSPLRIPRSNRLSHYTDRSSLRRQISREASFTSAKSMPDSVLSEGDLPTTQGERTMEKRRGLRRDASAMADLGNEENPFGLQSTPTRKVKDFRRRESQSSYEPSLHLGRKKLSIEFINAKDRRGRSEGAVAGGSILHKEGYSSTDELESVNPMPHLDLPNGKEGPNQRDLLNSSPTTRNSTFLHPLRPSVSHRSIGQASKASVGAHAMDGYQTNGSGFFSSSPSTSPAKYRGNIPVHSNIHNLETTTDADTSVGLDTSEGAKIQRMKERARKRYLQGQVGREGGLPRTSTHLHARDLSRQSRISRASTAGTFGSIGTRFSEGSFGASGGVRSRLAKTFRVKDTKMMEARARDLKLEHKRHGGRSSGKGGVLPGAIGTSAGGTKWVGQTFEVGKRFWEVVESREAELGDDTIKEEGLSEEEEKKVEEEKRKQELLQSRKAKEAAEANQTGRATDTVLDNYARQAQEATDEHESPQSRRRTFDSFSGKQLPTTPALTFTGGSDSDLSKKEPQTPPKTSNGDHLGLPSKSLSERPERKVVQRETSQASFISVPHEHGPDHESNFDIESRQGWSDVVSFMSAQSSAKTRESTFTDLSNRARKAIDGNFGLDNLRARQNEKRVKQQEARSALSRSAIREASTGSPDIDVKAGQASKEENDQGVTTGMSAQEALHHPEAPIEAEDRYPHETFALLRQPSDPGVRPEGLRDDAASDHQIAARPTMADSPVEISPHDTSSHSRLHHGKIIRERTETTSSAAADATPFLKKVTSASDIGLKNGPSAVEVEKPSILQGASIDTGTLQKKSVQFQGANSLTTPATRGFNTSFFTRNSPSSEIKDGFTLLAGRTKSISSGDAAPVPPQEVLSRNATPDGLASPHYDVNHHASSPKAETMITRQSIIKRDRMLVRLAWSPSEDLPKDFNERESRKYPMYSDPFKEFMVVYRTGRLELWEDPSFLSKCVGQGDQLKLYAAISLKRGRAFVSMFSSIDRIFCLTFVKNDDDQHHRLLDLRRSGTCIWIFDARATTIGTDWMWELSRELGTDIPEYLDVHLPALSVRVRIPIPEEMPVRRGSSLASGTTSYLDAGEGYKLISRDHVKKVIRTVIAAQPEWTQLCLNAEVNGLHFELAWRNEATLDWITEDHTNRGEKRDWAVVVGTMISEYKRPSVLEYRPAIHYPTAVQMPKGEIVSEPPGIEGFLWRVKAVSGALTRLYITTHDGLIFINRPTKAFPPDRHLAANIPDVSHTIDGQYASTAGNDQIDRERRRKRDAMMGRKRVTNREESLADLRRQVMATTTSTATTEAEIDAQIEAYQAFEKRRQFEQINNSDGYVDVRDIILIKSLDGKGPVRRPTVDERREVKEENKVHLDGEDQAAQRDGEESEEEEEGENGRREGKDDNDDDDLGGEEGLSLAKDRVAMKRNRQFEVTLTNGRTIRFEAYSKSVAREWVERLSALSLYWKRREKVDALQLMDATGLDPAMIGKRFQGGRAPRMMDQSADGDRVASVLGGIWNWCLYHSCRGILRSGRLFQKKKAYTGFVSRYYILIAGRLLHYKLMTSNRTARSRQNSGIFHKRQETVVHLRDAYVYSGKLTEDMLLNGRSEGAGAISTFGRGTGGASSATSRHLLPRVYGDGLLSVDDDEACTFVIRYRPQRVNQAADPKVKVTVGGTGGGKEQMMDASTTTPASPSSFPTLGDKTYNNLVLRARSKLERDLWVRAINIECERLNREDHQREEKIRETGKTPWKTSSHHH